jgi:hypothetical protein
MKLHRVLLATALAPACIALAACDGGGDTDSNNPGSSVGGTGGVGGVGTGGVASGGTGTGATTGTGGVAAGGTGGVGVGGAGTGGAGTGGGGVGGAGTGGAGTGGAGTGGAGTGGTVGSTFAEDEGADCTVGDLPDANSLQSNGDLPDPFQKLDGTRISSKADWRCRRQEIKKQAEEYVFGEKPIPTNVTGTVSSSSITVEVEENGKSTSFEVSIDLPSGSGPFPALVSYGEGFFGFSQNDLVKGEGVAIINYDPYVVGAEGTGRANKQGAFYDIYGSNSSTGLLAAWAWGVSRIIDVIEQSDGSVLEVEAMAVAGCSRFGKGAFAAGVLDQRIALTIPFESGSAGVPIYRGIPGEGAQTLSSAYGEQPWFGDAFGDFTSNPGKLPIDTHELVAMVAPRGLLILDNPHIANLGPKSAHVAALGGAEVYKALGVGDNISYHSAVSSGDHCSARPEHQEPLRQNIAKFLHKTGSEPGVITAAQKATGNLSEWRDWDTPTLD